MKKLFKIFSEIKNLYSKQKSIVYNMNMHEDEKRQINQPDKILELYQELGISPQQFPPYTDPSSFSRQFKKCTIYEPNELVYSSSVTMYWITLID